MRILQSIFIFLFFFFASNQCDAGIFDSALPAAYDPPPCAEKTDLNDSYNPVNLIHFFQRTEQVNCFHSTGQEFSGELFFRFGNIKDASANLIPAFLFCTPIGIILIFPKHYFF